MEFLIWKLKIKEKTKESKAGSKLKLCIKVLKINQTSLKVPKRDPLFVDPTKQN